MGRRFQFFSTAIAAAVVLASCSEHDSRLPKEIPTGKRAHAELRPTKGNEVTGEVTFIELEDGVRVIANIKGLKQGSHGFHIHEFGDCSSPDGSSAGGHFNPTETIHAGPDDLPRHVGDLGNVAADSEGEASYDRVNFLLKLSGEDSIVGKSVIVHEDRDDYLSQPTGNAGARVACGLIVEDSE